MTSPTRRAIVLAVLAAGASAALPAAAQAWPSRPVKLIVPYPVGTANEVFARVIAQRLSEAWKQPVVVEATPGAGGVVGSQAIARAPNDGYTLGWVSSPHAINAAIYPQLPYDTLKDFRPIVSIASTPLVFVAGSGFAGNGIADLLAMARERPRQVHFASNGNGSSSHLATELLASTAGVQFMHVPYKNTGQMMTDLASGQVQFAALGIVTSQSLVKAGRLKALGVTSTRRAALLPQVAAVAETVPGYETKAWMGLVAPAGTADTTVQRVAADAAAALRDPAVVAAMAAQGLDAEVLDAGQFHQRIESDMRTWKKIVQEAGIKLD